MRKIIIKIQNKRKKKKKRKEEKCVCAKPQEIYGKKKEKLELKMILMNNDCHSQKK